jgi:hypothetical protein
MKQIVLIRRNNSQDTGNKEEGIKKKLAVAGYGSWF